MLCCGFRIPYQESLLNTRVRMELQTQATFFFKILFICQRASESKHRQTEWKAESDGEAGSLRSKEPDVGLDPRTLGS